VAVPPCFVVGIVISFWGLHGEVVRMLQTPEVQKRFRDLAMATIGDTREAFGAFLKAEFATWGKAVKISGAEVE